MCSGDVLIYTEWRVMEYHEARHLVCHSRMNLVMKAASASAGKEGRGWVRVGIRVGAEMRLKIRVT